jgi:hypothetical protein
MVNNHFADDLFLSLCINKGLVDEAKYYLVFFSKASKAIINDHKIGYWSVDIEEPHN